MKVRRHARYRLLRAQVFPGVAAARNRDQTSGQHRLKFEGPPIVTYLICTNPRSGSWLLSEGLASTSIAGNAREWFNSVEEQQWRARWRMNHSSDGTYASYLNYVRAQSTTPNGVSGVKLHYYQFVDLPGKLWAAKNDQELKTAALMAAVFPNIKYLWLTRRDKARQAISYQLACQTGIWWVIDDGKLNNIETGTLQTVFDPHAIACLEQVLVENDRQWQSYFQSNNIAPLILYYEDLLADYPASIRRVLRWLEVPESTIALISSPRLRKQANGVNAAWGERYMAFKAGGGQLAPAVRPFRLESPLYERSLKPFAVIPDAWKGWIVRQKRLKTDNQAIIEVLTKNDYTLEAAIAEVGQP
jgi:trehalose 2-sulfotransferase